MPEISAFRGWRYDAAKAGKARDLVAPPYDVISPAEQEELYRRNPNNVIRLELGKDEPGDGENSNKYTRAAGVLEAWKRSGVLRRDERPCLYVHVQEYKEEGKKKTRIGFFASMKLDEKAVLKHENTLSGPKEDRFSLLKATRMNVSPIFGLFEDASGAVQNTLRAATKSKPAVDVTVAGVRHILYVDSDPARIAKVEKALAKKPMYIADGHHRFETACRYRDWLVSQGKTPDGFDGALVYFSDCRHNPFKIFPTHRLVKFPAGVNDVAKALSAKGKVVPARSLAAVLAKLSGYRKKGGKYEFGAYSRGKFWLLTVDAKLAAKLPKNPVDQLDVAALHRLIIEPCFGIRAIEKSKEIDFTRDAKAAVEAVDSGKFDAALFLRPTSLDEMLVASRKGLKMPQKSTYFYPKLLTDLVMRGIGE